MIQTTHTPCTVDTHRAAGARSNMLRLGLQDAGLCRVKESGAQIKVWWWAENDFLASSEILRPTALLPHLTRSLMLSGTPRGMEREGATEKYSRVCVCEWIMDERCRFKLCFDLLITNSVTIVTAHPQQQELGQKCVPALPWTARMLERYLPMPPPTHFPLTPHARCPR